MKAPNPDKLFARAQQERKEKIERANREYAEEVRHIKWLRQQLNGHSGSTLTPKTADSTAETNDGVDTNLRAAVRSAISALQQFTADDVVAWLQTNGANVNAKDRREAIVSILSRMNGKKTLKTVQRGTRGKPQVYKIPDESSTEGEPIPKSTAAHS